MRANEFIALDEARRNNFGRETSHALGKAAGKQGMSADQMKKVNPVGYAATQMANPTSNDYRMNQPSDDGGTPNQKLPFPDARKPNYAVTVPRNTSVAVQNKSSNVPATINNPANQQQAQSKPVNDYFDDNLAIDPDEVRKPGAPSQAQPAAAAAANANPAATAPAAAEPTATPKTKPANSGGGLLQQLDRFKQSDVGQKLGGWSQRFMGVGSVSAAGKQIWMNKFLGMVNNLIATERNAGLEYDFGQEMQKYLNKQNIHVPSNQMAKVIEFAKQVQTNGYKRPEILQLANTIWAIGVNASSNKSAYNPAGAGADKNANAGQGAFNNMANQLGKTQSNPAAQSSNSLATTTPATKSSAQASAQPTNLATQQNYSNVNQGPVRWHTSQQLKGPQQAAGKVGMDDPNIIDVDAREVPDAKQIGMAPRQIGMTKPATKQAPTGSTPVGTKFALKVRGQLVKAEKTADGWKVQGKLINDPKQAAVLDKQAKLAMQNKGRPPASRNPAAAGTRGTKIQPNRPSKPVRKLKTPSALAKGTPGKPAQAGKSRLRK